MQQNPAQQRQRQVPRAPAGCQAQGAGGSATCVIRARTCCMGRHTAPGRCRLCCGCPCRWRRRCRSRPPPHHCRAHAQGSPHQQVPLTPSAPSAGSMQRQGEGERQGETQQQGVSATLDKEHGQACMHACKQQLHRVLCCLDKLANKPTILTWRMISLLRAMFCCARCSSSLGRTFSRLHSTAQHSTAQHSTAQHSGRQHQLSDSCKPHALGAPQQGCNPAHLATPKCPVQQVGCCAQPTSLAKRRVCPHTCLRPHLAPFQPSAR
jgi:hypothetical protein